MSTPPLPPALPPSDPPHPPPPTPPPLPPDASHRDRHGGLIAFGLFSILIGALFLVTVPTTVIAQVALTRQAGQAFEFGQVLPTIGLMSLLGAAAIWLGVGSMQARRWARALLLCCSSIALVGGLIVLALLPAIVDSINAANAKAPVDPDIQPVILLITKVIAVVIAVVMYVGVPGAFVLFYRSRHVRRTCELRDPVERWTDRCPLPVLAICLVQAAGAGSVLFTPGLGAGFPIGNFALAGWPARLLWLAFGVFSLWVARGFYRLDRRAWLAYFIVILALVANYTIALHLLGQEGYYRAFGLPDWQIKQMMENPFMRDDDRFTWLTALAAVPFAGYLLYLRRYFPKAGSA